MKYLLCLLDVITLPTIYWQVRMWTVVVMNVIEKTEEGRRNLIDNHIHDEMFFHFFMVMRSQSFQRTGGKVRIEAFSD